jgi:hypothetical protein
MNVISEHKFDCGTINVLRPDVLLIEYANKKSVDVDCIIATRKMRESILGQVPYFPIIDMRKGFVSFTKEAKDWVAKNNESSKYRQLDVFIVSNWGLKLEVNLYFKLHKPIVMTKIVTTLDQALKVIDEFKEKQLNN